MPVIPDTLTWQTHQFEGVCAPCLDDDCTRDFSFGSFWFDLSCHRVYMCLVATEGAAVWKRVSASLDDAVLTVNGELILANEELVYI